MHRDHFILYGIDINIEQGQFIQRQIEIFE